VRVVEVAKEACNWRTDKYSEIPLYLKPLCESLKPFRNEGDE